jgi:hypothetical protein
MSKAAWLVDVGYVVKTAGKGGMKLDYVAAERLLAGRYGPVSTFLFNSYDNAYGVPDGLAGFYDLMEQRGMVVRLHPMSGDEATGSHRQRRVDVDLACHAIWQASLPDVEHVVLTTGDQDLIPAVEMCRARFGTAVVLFTFRQNVSRELAAAASERLLFEDFRSEVER